MASIRKPANNKYYVGNLVWVEDRLDVWSPAKITEMVTEKTVRLYYLDHAKMSSLVTTAKIHSIITPQTCDRDIKSEQVKLNLTDLTSLSTPNILHAVAKAYWSNVYYLGLGPGTVLALNPFQEIPNLFNRHTSTRYNEASLPELSRFSPHIFMIAERALRHMRASQRPQVNQSIVISGESGAGKTWSVCSLMKYFAQVSSAPSSGGDGSNSVKLGSRIESRILSSNPVLEAFGNASTRRNHNSSRFGKYIKLQYNRRGVIVGATLDVYLLEKTRAAHYDEHECSFHVFYQLLNGATEAERKKYMLPQTPGFISTKDRERYHEHHSGDGKAASFASDGFRGEGDFRNKIAKSISRCNSDADDFKITKASMLSVGISPRQQEHVFSILSSILHLKQIVFNDPDECLAGSPPPCVLSTSCRASVESAVALLSLTVKDLREALTVRKIQPGVKNKRHTVFKNSCTKADCLVRRDVMVKLLYEKVFLWVVAQIARDLSVSDKCEVSSFIGLLDVYGFECFAENSLEQMCINYANERLQQYYVQNFLKLQQSELEAQGVEWKGMDIDSSKNCLASIESQSNSVFSFLNEECRLSRADSVHIFHVRIKQMFVNNEYITMPRKATASPSFVIKHFAGKVVYSADQLVFKNRDDVPNGISELLRTSKNPFICDLVPKAVKTAANKGRSFQTVVSHFKSSLDKLLATMADTNCHYIRCVKPNTKSLPLQFEPQYVVEQLRASGIVETAQICSLVHPYQVPIKRFVEQFSYLLPENTLSLDFVGMKPTEKVTIIMISFLKERNLKRKSSRWNFGKENVFLFPELYEALLQHRANFVNTNALKIQNEWRSYARRKQARELIRKRIEARVCACVVVQRWWKRRRRQRAATRIQHAWRRYKERQLKLSVAHYAAAVTIQKAVRRHDNVTLRRKRKKPRDISMAESTSSSVVVVDRVENPDDTFVDLEIDFADDAPSSIESFVVVPFTNELKRRNTNNSFIFFRPIMRFNRPFLFSHFQSSSMSAFMRCLCDVEVSSESKLRQNCQEASDSYTPLTASLSSYLPPSPSLLPASSSRWQSPNRKADNVNILPFVNAAPRNHSNKLNLQ